jgi:hypothetical protein
MAKLTRHKKTLLITLTILTIANTTLCLTQPAQAFNIKSNGDIKILEEDGKTELTAMKFQFFTPGKQETQYKSFIVTNTGKQNLHASWAISQSSITWLPTTKPNQPGYAHTQDRIQKYTLRILQDTQGHDKCLQPEEPDITLKTKENTKLNLELTYTGKPTTPETFTLTITFSATSTKR